jgi:hypothetical protein
MIDDQDAEPARRQRRLEEQEQAAESTIKFKKKM